MKRKNQKLNFAKKVYTIEYIVNNPPNPAKDYKDVWGAATEYYFSQSGIDLKNENNYKRPIKGIDFAEIMRTFKKLMGNKKVSKRDISIKA